MSSCCNISEDNPLSTDPNVSEATAEATANLQKASATPQKLSQHCRSYFNIPEETTSKSIPEATNHTIQEKNCHIPAAANRRRHFAISSRISVAGILLEGV